MPAQSLMLAWSACVGTSDHVPSGLQLRTMSCLVSARCGFIDCFHLGCVLTNGYLHFFSPVSVDVRMLATVVVVVVVSKSSSGNSGSDGSGGSGSSTVVPLLGQPLYILTTKQSASWRLRRYKQWKGFVHCMCDHCFIDIRPGGHVCGVAYGIKAQR